MLQSALASSEARAEKLNEELARKPVSKDKLENQVSVLSHRLASVEEECARWKREAEQLEEVLANERVKFESLKKKLTIAESGPDKLTKKEINYWRANAEKFDEQINAYKSRIAALKRELREKDQILAGAHPDPSGDLQAVEPSGDLSAPRFSDAEVATLRHQIAGLNAVLADAHAARERLESELADVRARLERAEQAPVTPAQQDPGLRVDLERAQQDNARLRSALQLSEAELHELRRTRADLASEVAALKRQLDGDRSAGIDHERQLQLLTAQLEQARSREASLQADLEAAREDLANRAPQLPSGALPAEAAERLNAELDDLRRQRTDLSNELAAIKQQLDGDRGASADRERQHQLLAAQLEEARAREVSLQNELESTRRALADREQQMPAGAVPGQIAEELKAELARAQQESADLRAAATRSTEELAELREAREGLAAELAELQRRIEADASQSDERDRRELALSEQLAEAQQREAKLRADLDDRMRASEGQQETTQALHDAVATAERKAADAEAQLTELAAELKEEKEYSENLSELANSRQDQVNKLQDSVEEARERLDDALWRLEKASHFQRLVARRKGLIASLIEALRAKNKAMVALKAGLDSLRNHKAMVEETQQKLLVRMEALKTELGASRDRIKSLEAEAATISQRKPEPADEDSTALNERLSTQAELIQSLENELKTTKAFKREAEEKQSEAAQLQEELETKNSIIERLQSDLDDQQRKLAKLRGSDSETMRLKAVTEKDRSTIDILERENAELRAMIESAEQARPENGGAMSDDREMELQAKIAELTEAVGKWKKKYEFLATEAPAAYQTQTATKQ